MYGEDWISSPVTNSCYRFVNKDKNCQQASKWCATKSTSVDVPGPYPMLVRIETQAENDWIHSKSEYVITNDSLVGIHRCDLLIRRERLDIFLNGVCTRCFYVMHYSSLLWYCCTHTIYPYNGVRYYIRPVKMLKCVWVRISNIAKTVYDHNFSNPVA